MAIASPFVWGRGGAALTPAEIAKRRQIEDAILAQGVDTSPVQHWLQGLARVGNAAAGAFRRGQLDEDAAQSQALGGEAFNKLLNALNGQQGGATSGVPMSDAGAEVAATSPTAGGDAQSYRDAIASIESAGSGDYDAIGPRHPKMGRALGRYQVMESNIGPWSMEALGREVTPDEFMADPAIQDAIFDNQFGKYVQKYGPEGAAQAWFGGEGGVGKLGRKDVLGTSIGGYGKKFLNALGGQEVASLDPTAGMAEGAIVPGAEPIVSSSLADEVAEYEGTPEYAARFGNTTGQPLADNEFDKRFGDTPLPTEQLQGRAAIEQALVDQQQRATGGQQAIATQTAGMPVTGQAAQSDGIMQAISGTNAGGVFGLNPMQEQSAREYAQANILQDPAFIEAMSSPYLSDQQRAIAQTMVEQRMRQQAAEREMRMKQADPAYQLGLKKTQLEIENMENPRLTPADKLAREKFDYERGTADRTNDVKNYEYYAAQERAAGREPLGVLDWETAQRKASASNTNVTVGEGDKFYEALDKKNAETFATLSEGGMGARARAAQLDQLEALLQQSPSGAEAGLKLWAGDWGINTEGINGLQATRALIEKMVPEQRQPGSGPMSDADIAMYRRSLPTVLNQPGGNSLVIGTAKAIAQYDMQMGEISDRVADREISPAEGRRLIRELQNPLAEYTKRMRELGIDKLSEEGAGTKTKTGRTWRVVE